MEGRGGCGCYTIISTVSVHKMKVAKDKIEVKVSTKLTMCVQECMHVSLCMYVCAKCTLHCTFDSVCAQLTQKSSG